MSNRTSIVSVIAFVVSATAFAPAARGEALLPLERQVREQFPSVVLDSQATFEPAQEFVAGKVSEVVGSIPISSTNIVKT